MNIGGSHMYPIKLEFGHLAIQGDHKAVKKGSLPLTQDGFVGLVPWRRMWCLSEAPSHPSTELWLLLTLNENSRKGLLEFLLCFFHVFLMGSFLIHQAANVAVGRLDHRVEVVGAATIHLSSFNPGQQGLHSFWEFRIIWKKKIFQIIKSNHVSIYPTCWQSLEVVVKRTAEDEEPCMHTQAAGRQAERTKDPKSSQTGCSLWRIFRKRIVSSFQKKIFFNRYRVYWLE